MHCRTRQCNVCRFASFYVGDAHPGVPALPICAETKTRDAQVCVPYMLCPCYGKGDGN